MQKLPKEAVLHSMLFDHLDNIERKKLNMAYAMLETKLKNYDNAVDIKKFANHFMVTEIIARRMILNIEYYRYGCELFKFENGDKEYKNYDEIRNAQIQKRAESSGWWQRKNGAAGSDAENRILV